MVASAFGKGAKEKLQQIADITQVETLFRDVMDKQMDSQLTKVGIEIAQLSLEKLQILVDSENKKFDATEILTSEAAKQFWIRYAGKEVFLYPNN